MAAQKNTVLLSELFSVLRDSEVQIKLGRRTVTSQDEIAKLRKAGSGRKGTEFGMGDSGVLVDDLGLGASAIRVAWDNKGSEDDRRLKVTITYSESEAASPRASAA